MTKAKALILNETNEWAIIQEGDIFTSEIPKLLSPRATREGLERLYPYLDFDEVEIVEVDVGLTK